MLDSIVTSIKPGIYVGNVTCEYTAINTVQGIVDNYTYDFNETFSFDNDGNLIPQSSNPNVVVLSGITFTVTDRVNTVLGNGATQTIQLEGELDGITVHGTVTLTFLPVGDSTLEYRADLFWTYRISSVGWTESESCTGLLSS